MVMTQEPFDRRVYQNVRINTPDKVKMLIGLLYEHLSNVFLGKGAGQGINIT